MDWSNICKTMRHAQNCSEMEYQKFIKELILEDKLGWDSHQITEQLYLQLGSTERLVPDLFVRKDEHNSFIIEVKKPGHKKTNGNIDQLLSYMKQLEIPVGIYWGDDVEVYWKTIGDGSAPMLLLSLNFNERCEDGDVFVSLFTEENYSLDAMRAFKEECEVNYKFELDVNNLLEEVTVPEFQEIVKRLISNFFLDKDLEEDVVKTVMNKVCVTISSVLDRGIEVDSPVCSTSKEERIFIRKGNRGIAQRYAYELIRNIIEKNRDLNFDQLFAIFKRKNRIEKLSEIKDEKRWCLADEDIITLSDGTKIAVSNQWGFNGSSKPKMDNLREVAKKFGIDTSMPI